MSNLDSPTDNDRPIDSNERRATKVDDSLVPKVGMAFQSEEEAYAFYNKYAGKIGFSIRKCHSKTRLDKSLCAKYLVCSNEGQKETHPAHETKNERASTRSSCKAFVRFTISRDGI